MSSKSLEVITEYEALFALRTGVTILFSRHSVLDGMEEEGATCFIDPDSPNDLLIKAQGKSVVLKNMDEHYLEEARSRGSLMFYELENEEVVRCTPCKFDT